MILVIIFNETTIHYECKRLSIYDDNLQPGKPQQNAYIERYNRTVRYGLLNQHLFNNLNDIQDCATRWLWFYNHERPHQANGGKPSLMGFDSTETCH